MGGTASRSPADVGARADAVFVMVMNGDQARAVILDDGLQSTMQPGSVILLTATIKPSEAREIAAGLDGSGLEMIDSPVSGGFPGAQGGTLTMMAAGKEDVLARCQPIMAAVGKDIYKVGDEIGMGQTVKACLQSIMGSVVTATTEAAALAAKGRGRRGGVSPSSEYVVGRLRSRQHLSAEHHRSKVRKNRQPHPHHVQGPDHIDGHGARARRAHPYRRVGHATLSGRHHQISGR